MKITFEGDLQQVLRSIEIFAATVRSGPVAPHSGNRIEAPEAIEGKSSSPPAAPHEEVFREPAMAPIPSDEWMALPWQQHPVKAFDLSTRATNALIKEGFEVVGDVVEVPPTEIEAINGINRRGITAMRAYLNQFEVVWSNRGATETEPLPTEPTGAVELFDDVSTEGGAPEPDPALESEPEPEPEVKANGAAESAKPLTFDGARAVLAEVAGTDGLGFESVQKLLGDFGVKRIADMREQDLPKLVASAQELMGREGWS